MHPPLPWLVIALPGPILHSDNHPARLLGGLEFQGPSQCGEMYTKCHSQGTKRTAGTLAVLAPLRHICMEVKSTKPINTPMHTPGLVSAASVLLKGLHDCPVPLQRRLHCIAAATRQVLFPHDELPNATICLGRNPRSTPPIMNASTPLLHTRQACT